MDMNHILLIVCGIIAVFCLIMALLYYYAYFISNRRRLPEATSYYLSFAYYIISLAIFLVLCFKVKNTIAYEDTQNLIGTVEEYYIDNDILKGNDISEYAFRDKLNNEIGSQIIQDAVEDDRISVQDDGRVYIGQQELLDVLGLN